MRHEAFAKYLNPWTIQRDRNRRRLDALRSRDGDNCSRCRRPIRFDLPPNRDQAPTIEQLRPGSKAAAGTLDNLCLCHVRCNAITGDSTPQVQERMRLRAEAAAVPQKRAAGRR